MATQTRGWTREALVTALRKAASRLGHSPSQTDFDALPGPSSGAVQRFFGGWNDALLSAGLPLNQTFAAEVPIPDDITNHSRQGAYRKGYRARLEGVGREGMPYKSNCGGHNTVWLRGWNDADEWAEGLALRLGDE